jgi:hypothetical protein
VPSVERQGQDLGLCALFLNAVVDFGIAHHIGSGIGVTAESSARMRSDPAAPSVTET